MVLLEVGNHTNSLEPFALEPCSGAPASPPHRSSYLLLLGGVREPLLLLTPTLTAVLRPRLLRTCFSIQARRFVRLLCSDSTIRGHGLHSAMSRAAMAMARPTCGESGLAQCLGLPTQEAVSIHGCCVGLGCTAQWKGRRGWPHICSTTLSTVVLRLFTAKWI